MYESLTTRRVAVAVVLAAATLISASCGGDPDEGVGVGPAAPTSTTVGDPPMPIDEPPGPPVEPAFSPDELVEVFLDTHIDPWDEIMHIEVTGMTCETVDLAAPDSVRCGWERTSPVGEAFGWPTEVVTEDFVVTAGTHVDRASSVSDYAPADEGLVRRHLAEWLAWVREWNAELVTGVTPLASLEAGADVVGLRNAYWQYMALLGLIDLRGLPGAPSASF